MPRTLNDDICKMTFLDKISNTKLTLHYRLPTSEERISYTNAMVTRRGNKITNTAGEARRKYGALIMTGFDDGCFDKGKDKPLSSDSASPHYDPAWKTFIKQYASDVTELLAIMVFEASLSNVEQESDDPEDDGFGEDKGGEGLGGDPS